MFGSLRNLGNFDFINNERPKNNYLVEVLINDNNGHFWENISVANHFVENDHKYYSLHHGSEYKVKMTNNTGNRVNALLKIDGVRMGKWRVDPYSDVIIERPADNQRKFTFVKENSWEASSGNVIRGSDDNGLIEVTFVPEFKISVYSDGPEFGPQRSISFKNNCTMSRNNSYSAGATVLGNDSTQSFGSASNIHEDQNKKEIRRIRLVVSNERKPYTSLRSKNECFDDPIPPKLTGSRMSDL